MSEKLNQESDIVKFQKIEISKSEYHKNKIDNNEIYIQGKLYDIKTIIYTPTSVILFACNDNLEEEIINHIRDFFSESGSASIPSKTKHLLTDLFSLIYVLFDDLIKINTPLQGFLFNFSSLKVNDYTFTSDITTPPPEY